MSVFLESSQKIENLTLDNLAEALGRDTKIKLAGVDIDGILRGKLISKKKFLSVAKDGFGFCSVLFGWDMHDMTYFRELKISNAENGYKDLVAKIDLSSYRRIPWENDVPFFLVNFFDADTGEAVSACPRSLLRTAVAKAEKAGYSAMAGGGLSLRPTDHICCSRQANQCASRVRILPISRPCEPKLPDT
jgi:glutamine synthetase